VGAFDRVVAVSDYCTYPPAVKSLPRIGGWNTPTLEKIVALRPDLVILTEAQAPFLQDQLHQLNIRTLVAPGHTVQDVFTAITEIGQATGNPREAAQLNASVKITLDGVRERARRLPRVRTMCVVDRTPGTLRDLYVATKGSYLAELIDIAGGDVIGRGSKEGYDRISKETVIRLNPQVILDFFHPRKGAFQENEIATWNELAELDAVKNKRVYPVHDEFVVHPSQMIAKTAVLFATLLHPEVPAAEWGTP
jgi:iron complex transport system substrate-binding protein